jgi:DNA repair protein RecN (Recombination protein N)
MYLARLRIENLALVERVDVEFPNALLAVTGETGAGKSMILGSLQLLLGQRADTDLLRKGAARASIEGVFAWDDAADPAKNRITQTLAQAGIELDGDEPLIVRRELHESGRSTAQIAGRLVPVRQLAEIAEAFIDIHSQHEQQSLTQRRWQRDMLDAYAGASELAARVRALHTQWRAAENEHADWLARERELRRQEDLLRFQLNDIRSVQLRPAEDTELTQRETVLAHATELAETLAQLSAMLDDDEQGLVTQIRRALKTAHHLEQRDPACAPWAATLSAMLQSLNDVRGDCTAYAARLEADPGELNRVQDRIHQIVQLKKKYGESIETILAFAAQADEQLQSLGSFEERLTSLRATADALRRDLGEAGTQLSRARRAAAPKLATQVTGELAQLGMAAARVVAQLTPVPEPGPHGMEELELLISTNPGEEPKPLAKIASGGELSRVMLALKCVAMRRDDVPVLVFDEIDAGISGAVAHAVAERLQRLAAAHQVFVITHMPQIACRAVIQFSVEKTVVQERTSVTMRALAGAERETELTRMLGDDSTHARAHARELLAHAPAAVKNVRPAAPAAKITNHVRRTK